MSGDELFDVCDADDRVIGQAPRRQVHAQGWLHRAVHIWVWNSQGELLLQMRTATKDEYPDCYTSSASGHVDAGESYDQAAHRELFEELRLAGDLAFVHKLPASPQTANEHTALYFLSTDTPPVPDPGEIARLEWKQPGAIAALLKQRPELFTPPFRQLFEWRFRGA
jgi:16S rRNA (adenine1518-N6/adenine1519-N6)-dimethyltransferase